MSLLDLTAEMLRLSKLLDDALSYLRRSTEEYAEAEHAYRLAKATAWVETPPGTVAEREARINGATAGLRRNRDLAEGMKQAALEAVRSRRAQLSALQTLAGAAREELMLARTGPS